MCGIGGKLSFTERPDPAIGAAMNDCQTHRGPDAAGVYANGPALLAHRRLSILGLGDDGRQPMSNDDGSVHIVFNGEIYNYRELRERVDRTTFRSETDTEVLLALYEEEGVDCLQHLRGMFAFGIWDETEQRLFLARDRLGQKPLFYRYDEATETVWFGSTIRTLLADDAVTARPDLDAIRSYLTYQYVPEPRTGFAGIEQVRPAEYLVYSTDGIERQRYWDLSFAEQTTKSPDTIARELREELREATRLRMRSDVPVGVFLSGGIDSSIVTGLMSELSEEPVSTYSIGFDSDRHDELDFARTVADHFGTDHHEYRVTPDDMGVLSELVEHYEMPFADSSALPTYYVSQKTATDVTVALGGDGGDEHFAGYDRYAHDRQLSTLRRIPAIVRLGAAGLLDSAGITPAAPRLYRAKRGLEIADEPPVDRYGRLVGHATEADLEAIWAGQQPDDHYEYLRDAFDGADGATRLDRLLEVDVRTYLPNDLLVKVDRASMAHSLEVRSPFLSHRVAEYAARIPAKYKLRGGTKKWILKRAFEGMLPDPVVEREKQGFAIPIHDWFRSDLRALARESIEGLGSRDPFDRDGLERALDEHVSGRENRGHDLWDYVMLEQWYERFIDS